MNVRSLIRRLRTSVQVLRGDPEVVLRVPRFAWQTFKEGPRASLERLRRLSDPLRFSVDYEAWLSEFGTTELEKVAMQVWAQELPEPAQIAVLMPVFNPSPRGCRRRSPRFKRSFTPMAALHRRRLLPDPRIRPLLEAAMTLIPHPGGVQAAQWAHHASSNSALELVQAPNALLDHDDLLPDDALIWVLGIQAHPEARLFYSDEDKISPDETRLTPTSRGTGIPADAGPEHLFISAPTAPHWCGLWVASVRSLRAHKTTTWCCVAVSVCAVIRSCTFRGCFTTGVCIPARQGCSGQAVHGESRGACHH